MNFRLPQMEDEALLRDYVQEHYANGERDITASHALTTMAYGEWVEKINRNAVQGVEGYGRSLVLLGFERERLVGLLSVRYELPQRLAESIGHIGYGVRPSERRKGYATEMLKHALDICRQRGLQRAIVGCFKDNTASEKTILKCGGVFMCESDNFVKGRLSRYFSFEF